MNCFENSFDMLWDHIDVYYTFSLALEFSFQYSIAYNVLVCNVEERIN